MDRKRNKDIAAAAPMSSCKIPDIVRWTRQRRREWNEHLTGMKLHRIAQIVRDTKPNTRRPMGGQPKRWVESWTFSLQKQST